MPVCIHGKEKSGVGVIKQKGGGIYTRACHCNLCKAFSKALHVERGVAGAGGGGVCRMYVGTKT